MAQKTRGTPGTGVRVHILTVKGGMSIARKWYRIEVDEEVQTNNDNLQTNKQLSIPTNICDQDEQCTDIIHCYEGVIPTRMNTKFCDKNKVCCKTKGKQCICLIVFSLEKIIIRFKLKLKP